MGWVVGGGACVQRCVQAASVCVRVGLAGWQVEALWPPLPPGMNTHPPTHHPPTCMAASRSGPSAERRHAAMAAEYTISVPPHFSRRALRYTRSARGLSPARAQASMREA